ncbi:MAG: RICIN domain-containing protein [Acetobacteraceae bacterium]
MLKALYVAASVIAVVLLADPAAANQPVLLFNSHTEMCLQPADGSMTQGAAIVEEPCNGNPAIQIWLVVPVGAGTHFENAITQFCLDARGKAENRTPVQQWTCNEITNENWDPEGPGGKGAPVKSRVSGSDSFCLDIPGGQQIAGLAMQIFACNGTVSQIWELRPTVTVVPNVVRLPEENAVNTMTHFGLQSVVLAPKGCTSPGAVTKQSPLPGFEAIPNSPVNLTVNCAEN